MVSYGYDGLLHLSSESRTGTNSYTALYVVDGVGNRTSSTLGGVTTTYTTNADDELTATSGGFVNSYGYNANGDQTTRTLAGTSRTLTYDYDDQLTSTGAGGSSFTYDTAGRRVSRTSGGVTTNFLYDGGAVLLEKQGSTTSATYTYGNALIRKDGETPLFDGLGSERTVTNSSQAVTATLTLSAFGQTIASSGSSSSPYQFGATSGYRTEGDAGLTLVGCRFYDGQVGRFITRDTYLDQAPYAYCDGDPVNEVDPSGHDAGDPPGGRAPYPPLPKPAPPTDPGGIPKPNPPIKVTVGKGVIQFGPVFKGTTPTGGTIIYYYPLPGGGGVGVGVYKPISGPTQFGGGLQWNF